MRNPSLKALEKVGFLNRGFDYSYWVLHFHKEGVIMLGAPFFSNQILNIAVANTTKLALLSKNKKYIICLLSFLHLCLCMLEYLVVHVKRLLRMHVNETLHVFN